MAILIFADHNNTHLKSTTYNAVGAAAIIAQMTGGNLEVVVSGSNCGDAAKEAAAIKGVSKVWVLDEIFFEGQLPENVAPVLANLARSYTHLVGSSSSNSKNILPRTAALLGVAQISEIISVEAQDTFKRPIYAGNAIATVKSLDPIKVITVRTTAFAPTTATGGSAEIATVEEGVDRALSRFAEERSAISDRPELQSAKVIVSGGLGVGSSSNFSLIEKLADKFEGAVGASRAAVDAGFAPNTLQIGQTGKVVAPELYFAVGISGAIQHLAGMKDSKIIVAINKDPEAPIFKVADYGLVGDLFEVLPELEKKL
ncbi:electron transfer flavoprotein subunit alpha/FixB family protein [Pseudomonas sp. NPDC087342]|uniref:electron transfer flavoprotein subunit alpha/FixB family protein n=1 Tax=Pseudomonas sp. NPDC087342 TaxID=3364437 RepID=UPI003830EB04